MTTVPGARVPVGGSPSSRVALGKRFTIRASPVSDESVRAVRPQTPSTYTLGGELPILIDG
jgi:hypothetical protein